MVIMLKQTDRSDYQRNTITIATPRQLTRYGSAEGGQQSMKNTCFRGSQVELAKKETIRGEQRFGVRKLQSQKRVREDEPLTIDGPGGYESRPLTI